ncbi:MAG: GNAT family N-acetyltransferase [Deltaproteobacteria bacterium]|nr:GNAT family N-acetyltransferase [Deltaproteobacteria bacterium]
MSRSDRFATWTNGKAAMAELHIERLWPQDLDSPSYRELITAHFGAHVWAAHRQYYRWLFEQAPTRDPEQPLSVYVARDGGQLIGHRAIIAAQVVVDGQRLPATWGVDHFVSPAHQGRQVGTRLLDADRQTYAISLSLGQTKAGSGIAAKNGYRDVGALLRYTRLLRPLRSVAKRAMAKLGLGNTVQSLFEMPAQRGRRASYDIAVAPVTSFADRINDRGDLRGARPSRAGICRTPAFMQWRYFMNPLAHYEVRRCRLGSYGEGYAVWRVFDDALWRRGVLVDLVYPDGVPVAMLKHVVAVVEDDLRAAGAEIFQCQTSDVDLIQALDNPILSRREPGVRFMFRINDEGVQVPTTIDRWSLNLGDCDVETASLRASQINAT